MVQERGETGIDAKQQLEGSSAELFEGCEQLFICLISGKWAQAAIRDSLLVALVGSCNLPKVPASRGRPAA
jgi:hypothetical protein